MTHEQRLTLMIDPEDYERDLSPNDVAAIRWALGEIARLRDEARRYYRPDGTFETLSTAEEALSRRILAAQALAAVGWVGAEAKAKGGGE